MLMKQEDVMKLRNRPHQVRPRFAIWHIGIVLGVRLAEI